MSNILSRLFKVGKAQANKAVSALEDKDPIVMIEAGLSDARKNLSNFESSVRDMGAEKVRLDKEVVRVKDEVKRWGEHAKTALEENNEGLATKALERQTTFETELEGLTAQHKVAKKGFEAMTQKVLSQKELIKNQESKMTSLKAKHQAAQANLKMRETIAKVEGGTSSFDQIARFEDKVNETCNKVEAADAMDEAANGEDLDAQFDKLESKSSVSDKMAALKASMAK
jgi:phage shock protein A